MCRCFSCPGRSALRGLPTGLDIVAWANPLSYGIDAFRDLLIDAGHYGLTLDLSVLTAVTVACMVAGSRFFNRVQV